MPVSHSMHTAPASSDSGGGGIFTIAASLRMRWRHGKAKWVDVNLVMR